MDIVCVLCKEVTTDSSFANGEDGVCKPCYLQARRNQMGSVISKTSEIFWTDGYIFDLPSEETN